jgi:hypothetical protein
MTNAVLDAAKWLATTPSAKRPHPLVPHLQRAFGLSAKEAVEAIREANLIKARAH